MNVGLRDTTHRYECHQHVDRICSNDGVWNVHWLNFGVLKDAVRVEEDLRNMSTMSEMLKVYERSDSCAD